MCRLEEVVLNGDDKVSGTSIVVEDEALEALFSGVVVLDAGLQVLHAAALMLQQLTLYCSLLLESFSFDGMVPFSFSDHLNKAFGNPHDSCKIPLPSRQCSGSSSWGDDLDLQGWEVSASWQCLRRLSLQVDRVVRHDLIAVGVVKGAVEVFTEVEMQ